jgi:signal transduction histidine kinase/ActR/RegA family two-component response regulator
MDRLVETACDLFDAPIGLASIYDEHGVLHRTIRGLDGIAIPLDFNVARTLMQAGPDTVTVVQDATLDPRVANHPFIVGPLGLRSYAGATISNRHGQPVGAIGVLDTRTRGPASERDIRTLRRLAMMAGDLLELEDAERDSTGKRQTLELAEAMAGVGHFRVDAVTRQVAWSDEVYRIHGFAPGSVDPTAESSNAAYFPEDAALVRGLIDVAIQTGEGYDARLRLMRLDGEERVTRTKAHCEIDARGKVVALVGVFQDITETVLAQDTLIDARKLAESHSQAKSDFLANMSHEIRTPLTSVIGFSSFLGLSQNLSAKERHYVDRISVASKALLGVINDVLDYSRLEAGAIEVERAPFNPRAMVEMATALVEDQCAKSGLALTVEVQPDVPVAFIGDEAHLRQVAVNFLSNAVKFTPDGSIKVTLSMAEDRLRLAVTDTGIGVAPEAIDRLFDRFTQANASTTRLYGGTGLGLAISRRLISLMDGEIGADSEIGKGSTFWFETPLPSVMQKPAPKASAPRTTEKVRVLVADDSPAIRRMVATVLTDAGIEVDEVGNGAEAVSMSRGNRYDAILMDVHMPVLDGVEACQTIHAMQQGGAKTPIIALTAAVSEDQVRQYLRAGMVGHVGKPLHPAELMNELGLALGGPNHRSDPAFSKAA